MILSEYTIVNLAKVFCGDIEYMPYMRGNELVHFFNKYGFNEVYGEGFPSRWKYAEDKLRDLNGTIQLKEALEDLVDPRRFHRFAMTVQYAVSQINELLKFDQLALQESGYKYKVVSLIGNLITPETTKSIDHEFINQQIEKCESKIYQNDFTGAITNARSLIEAIFIEIIERHENIDVKNDGDLDNLWKRVKKIMKLEIDKESLPDFVLQILSGLDTAVKGLAGLSNNAGDRHATKFKTRKHHAKLAVNLSMTLSDFILDSWNYQTGKDKFII